MSFELVIVKQSIIWRKAKLDPSHSLIDDNGLYLYTWFYFAEFNNGITNFYYCSND